eukprot:364577-Chlamydomonas_euryale.AAC.9
MRGRRHASASAGALAAITVSQAGALAAITVSQAGASAAATVSQAGGSAAATVSQAGGSAAATVSQAGAPAAITVPQLLRADVPLIVCLADCKNHAPLASAAQIHMAFRRPPPPAARLLGGNPAPPAAPCNNAACCKCLQQLRGSRLCDGPPPQLSEAGFETHNTRSCGAKRQHSNHGPLQIV